MKKLIPFLLFLLSVQGLYAQRCTLISMEHFGGNGSEVVVSPGVLVNVDNSFSLPIITSSISGNILTSCTHTIGGGGILRTYDMNYTNLQSQHCIFKGQNFEAYSFFQFPQNNGDTILIGQSDLNYGDFGIERRDASGNVVWTKHYGGTGNDGFGVAIRAPDSGFFLLGASNSHNGDVGLHYGSNMDADIWVLRVNKNCDKLWSVVIGGTYWDLASSIIATPDNGCYIFGVTSSADHDATGNQGGDDLYIVKLDSLGNKEWHRCLGGSGSDGTGFDNEVRAIRDKGNGFYVLARTDSHDGDVQQRMPEDYDFWLLHIDSVGHILWENTYGGPGWQIPGALCRAVDGSFWMGGYFLGNTTPGGEIDVTYGGNDGWVVHADSMGNFLNEMVLGADKAEYVDALLPLPDGTVLACGHYADYATPGSGSPQFPQTNEGQEDIFLARLGPETDLSIAEKKQFAASWELYPNPAQDEITVHIKNDERKYHISITDINGRQVYRDKFKSTLIIPTDGWSPGTYIVQIANRRSGQSSKKVTVKK